MKTVLIALFVATLLGAATASAANAPSEVSLPANYDIAAVAIDGKSGDLIYEAFDFGDGVTRVVRRDHDSGMMSTLYSLPDPWNIDGFAVRAGRVALGLSRPTSTI